MRQAPATEQQLLPDRRGDSGRILFSVVQASFPVLPYTEEAATWHAAERARLEAKGQTPPFVDGQIAAIAKVNELVLVTSNGADFAGFEDLRLADWRL